MLRSARPGNLVLRRGLRAATAVLAGAVMTVAGMATSAAACADTDGRGGAGTSTSRGGPTRGGASHETTPSPVAQHASGAATGAYVYRKRDASKPASWENSTQQYLVATWAGGEYRELTFDQVRSALAAQGVRLCGPGWGVQEDQAHGTQSLFTEAAAPSYPKATIGWPPIYAAQHWSLERFFAVPACTTSTPTPAPTRTAPAAPVVRPTSQPTTTPSAQPTAAPSVTPTPTPAAPTSTPTPRPTETAATAPTATPTPTASPAQDVASVVLSAPDSTQTKAPEVVSAVLAAGGGSGALAQTGAAPIGIAVAAVLLLAAGAVLIVLRRRGTAR